MGEGGVFIINRWNIIKIIGGNVQKGGGSGWIELNFEITENLI